MHMAPRETVGRLAGSWEGGPLWTTVGLREDAERGGQGPHLPSRPRAPQLSPCFSAFPSPHAIGTGLHREGEKGKLCSVSRKPCGTCQPLPRRESQATVYFTPREPARAPARLHPSTPTAPPARTPTASDQRNMTTARSFAGQTRRSRMASARAAVPAQGTMSSSLVLPGFKRKDEAASGKAPARGVFHEHVTHSSPQGPLWPPRSVHSPRGT